MVSVHPLSIFKSLFPLQCNPLIRQGVFLFRSGKGFWAETLFAGTQALDEDGFRGALFRSRNAPNSRARRGPGTRISRQSRRHRRSGRAPLSLVSPPLRGGAELTVRSAREPATDCHQRFAAAEGTKLRPAAGVGELGASAACRGGERATGPAYRLSNPGSTLITWYMPFKFAIMSRKNPRIARSRASCADL